MTARDVAEECVARVKQQDASVLAWETFDPDSLRRQAALIDENGTPDGDGPRPLGGIPVGVKDIFNTADFPTQMGSPLWRGFTPGNDARVVYQLRHAGALIPGKTVTAEFAVHALDKTLNPHDARLTPGTSSSGSAVAVAMGMVPAALGTQTAGSIVRPASFCGIYGCKPSFGLIPRTGMLKTTDTLDCVGFFVARPEDLELMFDVLRVHGRDYPISHAALSDVERQSPPKNRPWRLGFCRTHTWEHAEPYAREAVLAWIEATSKDADFQVEELALPPGFTSSHSVHATIYDKTLSYYFKEEFKRAELVSPIMNALIEDGMKTSRDDFMAALRAQSELARSLDSLLTDFDAIVCLSTSGEAPPRAMVERPDPALIWSLCHVPVVSAPAFRSPAGKPFGLQVVARRFNDPRLFRLMHALVERGHLPEGPHPAVPSLSSQ